MGKYNVVGNANGGFLGSSSARPIAGHIARNMFIFRLNQAKVADGANLAPALPAKLTNANGGKAGAGLSPNVLLAENATSADDISGFVVASPNDVLEIGGGVPKPQEGQVTFVALIGSGIEMYLPCDDTLQNVNVNTKAKWDTTNNKLTKATDGDAGVVSILGGVVDGVTYKISGDFANTVDSKVILVKL